MAESESPQDEWKERYLNALEQADERESSWQEVDNLLRQCISRLTLAVESSDDRLNRQLSELRSAIRSGHESAKLRGLIDSLSDTLLRLDEERKHSAVPNLSEFAVALLEGIDFPKGQRHRANRLIKELTREGEALEPAELQQKVTALLGEVFSWAMGEEGAGEEGRKGLLGRILKRDEVRAPPPDSGPVSEGVLHLLEQVVATSLVPPTEREPLRRLLDEVDQQDDLDRIAWEIIDLLKRRTSSLDGAGPGDVLIQLLERVDIPEQFREKSEKIRQSLLGNESSGSIAVQVVAIADLLSAIRQTMQGEREELELFLLNLTERLGELDHQVRGGLELHRTSISGGRELDESVAAEMQSIEQSVEQAQELAAIKRTIQQRVEIIRDHMSRFRQAEEQRLEIAERKVEQLTQQLTQMEQESGELRKRVADARAMAEIDPLTRLPNRLAYTARLAQEYARWKRYGAPLSLAIWDIDYFKKVNDSYGHQAGDRVLAVIAKLLAKQVRETDFVARYGGEEFVLLMPETPLAGALRVAEVLRESIASCEFHFKGAPVPITASCGISEFHEGEHSDQVFKRADEALYRAKQQGRNRCEASAT